jgi:23S rRNA (cytidine1920-2'-O)/16S rRNA (cytidine1409-2'-O)-methyltransferase
MPKGGHLKYVSRGALKLESALDSFSIDVGGAVAADIGASTGGFTDCLLKRGATRVYAVDCGTDQLDQTLWQDSRVVSIENFNARELTVDTIGEYVDIAVMDLSFISQTLVLPSVASVVRRGGAVVSLVKPQFECGRNALSKGGIVKEKSDHLSALRRVKNCAETLDLAAMGAAVSPILGGDGNREYLIYFVKNGGKAVHMDFEELVRR